MAHLLTSRSTQISCQNPGGICLEHCGVWDVDAPYVDFQSRLIPMFTAKNVRRSRKSAEAELRNLVSSSEELLKTLSDQGGDAVAALRVKLSRNIATAKQQMNVLGDALDSISEQAVEESTGFVARRPWTAVALGIVLGVAVGTAFAAVSSARR
jgi:ElaB/YqjD/DUF883 family membrane-anchored ribosome-binding protein